MTRRPRRLLGYAVLAFAAAVAAAVVAMPLVMVATSDPDGQPPPGRGLGTGPPTPGATIPATPTAPSGEPMPVGDLPGWRQVFTDDFTGTDLDDRWFRYEGQPEGDPGGWFDPSHVSVSGGKLVIGAWQEPARDNLYATGGVSNRNAFSETYGRFEIRFRIDRGTGIAYALLLWPATNESRPEIDIAEDNGRDRRTRYGVLHPADRSLSPEEYTVETDATEWHTAGLEWTPDRLVYTLDGEPWATVEGPQVPAEPMALALQSQAWYCGHSWEACPDETTPERVDLEVDWVAIYAYDP